MEQKGRGAAKTPDRRVVKTKKAIRNAFASLVTEKDFREITVSELAERAEINRKTFYNYYDGIYSVVEEIQNEILDLFDTAMNEIEFRAGESSAYVIFERLATVINSDLDFYLQLLQMRGSERLMDRIVEVLKAKTKKLLTDQVSIDADRIDLMLDFAFSGMISVYTRWLSSERSRPIEEVTGMIGTLCVSGINGVIGSGGDNYSYKG